VIKKSALAATALVLAAVGAQARDVFWSVGINAPIQPGVSFGTVFSNAPHYQPAPVYYQPAPVVYVEPVYYQPAPLVYLPQPYYAPRRVVYGTGWYAPRHGHGHGRGNDRGYGRDDYRQRGEPVMARHGAR
jgi:hypothetical protein